MAIQVRRGTNAEWENTKQNIVAGEPAVALDSERFFVGTGAGTYAEYANVKSIAPTYSTTRAYREGDYVMYNGKLYVCTTATTGGAWNADNWEETSLLDALTGDLPYRGFETASASGNIVLFHNGAGGIPVKDLQASIEAVQSGSGDPSPTNVRPISGWSSVNVYVTGKNLIPLYSSASYVTGGLTVARQSDGGILVTGTSTSSSAGVNNLSDLFLLPDGDYVLSGNGGDSSVYHTYTQLRLRKSVNGSLTSLKSGDGNFSLTEPTLVQFGMYIGSSSQAVNVNYEYYPMIRKRNTSGDFEPYNGTTYTVNLNGTRYGGTLDVTTGELILTHEYIDLGTYGINGTAVSSNVRRWYTTQNSAFKKVTLCNSLKASDSYVYTSLDYASISTDHRIAVTPTWGQSITTIADFNTAIANNPISVVIELATPQTVQLTPTEVRTLLKENNIWADSGRIINCTYRITNT